MNLNTEHYYVYIITDQERMIFETGITGALSVRLKHLRSGTEAAEALNINPNCVYLLYWEKLEGLDEAVEREKKIKKWSKKKKGDLIKSTNPEWRFLNDELLM